MFAEYFPEILMAFLEHLLLRKTTSLHHLSCAYWYLSMRQSQSCLGWSALSDEFTEDSFVVHYHDQSLHLQHLKAHIEEDALKMVSEYMGLHSKSPLPSLLVQAKVIVFELQCLACFHIWCSTIIQILEPVHPSSMFNFHAEQKPNLLMHVPELQYYFIECKEPNLSLDIHLHYYYPEHQRFGGNSIL